MYKAILDEVDSVAVKVLPSDQFRKDQLQAFLNEVAPHAWLQHEHCPALQTSSCRSCTPRSG